MEQNNDCPLDPAAAAALVIRAVEDIDSSTEEKRDLLLCDLLCAAWGSIYAQNQ
ncbi:MAG TPA: hypothetical protein VEJ23_01025 [Solirubrobacteraceae bacterium]|nr:hypothetical protein [Solirubrobacteraceae bacterium]